MGKLVKYLRHYKLQAIVGPLFKMLEASFELVVPVVMAGIIDIGIKTGNQGYIWKMCLVLVGLGALGLTCSLTAQYFAAKAALGFATELRTDLFAHINRFSYQELDAIGTSTLITRMTSDVNQVQNGVNLLLRLFSRAPFIVIGAVVMAFTISPRLTLIFLAAIPLIGFAIFLAVRLTIPIYRKAQNILDRVVLLTRENYVGSRVVRAFSRQDEEVRQFQGTTEHLKKTQLTAGRISAMMNPATYVLVNLAILCILLAGSREVYRGSITQGEVIALVNYMMQILLALVALANLIVTVMRASASAVRVNEVFAFSATMTDSENKKQTGKTDGPRVVFDHVTFTYHHAKEPSLMDISFEAEKGETIGIIGGTGSGKSTLVQLIPRFYDCGEGSVLVDGIDVKKYPFSQLRKKIGIVPQRAMLFAGTIRENLSWGKEDATQQEMDDALETAQAKEFVYGKPEGLDTVVAAGGRNFSGGQRQRLTIARAFVGKPGILILDDSASALDFATDAALRSAIRRDTGNATVFLVSQRAATVKNADCILVLDDGKMVGKGKHQELLKTCDVYREICLSQFSKEEVAGL
ncbi:ABC transporter ATP-binding protein/permease [Ruminococcus sp. OA3]|uniref:ABC transporter ATP-binding protein n=1 Tax=Ruminococcus sp. OA3 TaxID=2914164 RepID=UPI001F062F31|nr:ABC transporter ATP-binding protein [Ruminococcus sp. OA3]MCH1982804.1 ABC transporter ATP-binding protein/permease [Ruminococcus sp. OA3]